MRSDDGLYAVVLGERRIPALYFDTYTAATRYAGQVNRIMDLDIAAVSYVYGGDRVVALPVYGEASAA